MLRKKLFYSAAILGLLATLAPAADTVKLAGRPAFRNVTIVALDDGRLVFRGVSRELLRKPLAEVEWIAVEDAPRLNDAERAAARDTWDLALRLYIAATNEATSEWQRTWCLRRQVQAAHRCRRFADAVAAWVRLLEHDPESATDVTPRRPGPAGSAENRSARECLETALAARPPITVGPAIQQLLLQLLIYEELTPSSVDRHSAAPAARPPPSAAYGDRPEPKADAGSSPPSSTELGILPPRSSERLAAGPGAASTRPVPPPEAETPIGILPPTATDAAPPPVTRGTPPPATQPAEALTPRSGIELPRDSFVFTAIEEALDASDDWRAARLAERAGPHVPAAAPALRKYVRGLRLLAEGTPADAAAELIPLADGTDDPGLACRALYYGSLAHQRMKRPDVAAALCRELLARPDVPPELADRARGLLARVER